MKLRGIKTKELPAPYSTETVDHQSATSYPDSYLTAWYTQSSLKVLIIFLQKLR